MLDPTPKTSLHPKTKKKLWQDSRTGATAYKTKSHTHKVSDPQTVKYITEVFPQKWKFWAPWPASPALRSGNRSRSPQTTWRIWRLVGFDCGNSTGLAETETPLLECAHKLSCISGPRGKKSNDLLRTWVRPTCWYWESSMEVGLAVAHCWDRHWSSSFGE